MHNRLVQCVKVADQVVHLFLRHSLWLLALSTLSSAIWKLSGPTSWPNSLLGSHNSAARNVATITRGTGFVFLSASVKKNVQYVYVCMRARDRGAHVRMTAAIREHLRYLPHTQATFHIWKRWFKDST